MLQLSIFKVQLQHQQIHNTRMMTPFWLSLLLIQKSLRMQLVILQLRQEKCPAPHLGKKLLKNCCLMNTLKMKMMPVAMTPPSLVPAPMIRMKMQINSFCVFPAAAMSRPTSNEVLLPAMYSPVLT